MLTLTGAPLQIDDVVAVARHDRTVGIGAEARENIERSRSVVLAADAGDATVYGVTTGFGALADRAIPAGARVALQEALVRSHTAGMGPAVDSEIVRGMLLLRARTLCAGYSGVGTALVEQIAAALNAGLEPWVPEHGSLGASGDLAPLAHAASALRGEGWVRDSAGRAAPAGPALAAAGLAPLQIGVKEGLALINGTDGMAATLALVVHDLAGLLVVADCVAAMSVEALLGTAVAFGERVIALRPSPGQQQSAANLRALLDSSPIVASHRPSHHAVQDAYSLRCTPQVHGAARDALAFARQTVERELAAVVDNPVLLDGEMVSAGNFHGQALSYAADLCAAVCADVAAIAERRVDRLLDPARSRGLPAFLTRDAGLNSGLMIAQYTQAAIVAELRHAATPFAVHSMATSAGQEDHVSLGWSAAQRTRRSVAGLRRVLAVELVAAAQALDLRAPLRPGAATGGIVALLRGSVPGLEADRVIAGDLLLAEGCVRDALPPWAAAAGLT